MTRASEWLNGYITAWASKDPADVRAIFTEDAQYWFRPDDDDPVIGIDAIVEMWGDPEPSEPVHELAVLIENDEIGIIKGTVDYPGDQSYSNLWEVRFAPDGRATSFVEWFMTPRTKDV
ncbi:nuclear transport factor 2 family protein [Microbacterium sulfonylureivorans]|uniref:nuclear transport factor 2 family protein n=1 Tax=Microbacterium sulfonylureivorans TaxID=2486854 RepID=UPI000FDACCE7|nr:nuclear transport factor 2 family protein [Microbacterium sulfonylureivorans]